MAYPHSLAMVDGQAIVLVECYECSQPVTLTVPNENYLEWRRGQYIQDALPMLNVDQREMLISGICPDCWNKLFPEE